MTADETLDFDLPPTPKPRPFPTPQPTRWDPTDLRLRLVGAPGLGPLDGDPLGRPRRWT